MTTTSSPTAHPSAALQDKARLMWNVRPITNIWNALIMEEIQNKIKFRFNWGALTLTPLWLIRNGFLLSFVLYIFLSMFVWPVSVAFSILFFVKGSEWSWGDGHRWKNYEEFAESQFTWGFVGKIILILITAAWLWVLYAR